MGESTQKKASIWADERRRYAWLAMIITGLGGGVSTSKAIESAANQIHAAEVTRTALEARIGFLEERCIGVTIQVRNNESRYHEIDKRFTAHENLPHKRKCK